MLRFTSLHFTPLHFTLLCFALLAWQCSALLLCVPLRCVAWRCVALCGVAFACTFMLLDTEGVFVCGTWLSTSQPCAHTSLTQSARKRRWRGLEIATVVVGVVGVVTW